MLGQLALQAEARRLWSRKKNGRRTRSLSPGPHSKFKDLRKRQKRNSRILGHTLVKDEGTRQRFVWHLEPGAGKEKNVGISNCAGVSYRCFCLQREGLCLETRPVENGKNRRK